MAVGIMDAGRLHYSTYSLFINYTHDEYYYKIQYKKYGIFGIWMLNGPVYFLVELAYV